MNQTSFRNTLLVIITGLIVIYLLRKNKVVEVTASEKMAVELYSIKDALIPSQYMEKYRSQDNNGLTIAGTIIEQILDVMIAVLKQPNVKGLIDTIVKNNDDAITVAEAIETIGKETVKGVNSKQLLVKDGNFYRPDHDAVRDIIQTSILKNGLLAVAEDTSKYDKYYNALKNILLDMERVTNPQANTDRFPTIEVFKTQIMPAVIGEINARGGNTVQYVSSTPPPPPPPS
jgi:hypothetical protein